MSSIFVGILGMPLIHFGSKFLDHVLSVQYDVHDLMKNKSQRCCCGAFTVNSSSQFLKSVLDSLEQA